MELALEVLTSNNFYSNVADELVASINDAIDSNGRCAICLAGGKTPAAVYRLLGMPPRVSEVDWSRVSMFWGDERWVPAESDHSNYNMVRETLLDNLKISTPKVFKMNTALATSEETAIEYEKLIQGELGASELLFDIMLLGVGEDGHTASIFDSSSAISSDKLVLAVESPAGDPRVTLTKKAILRSRKMIYLLKGASKCDIAIKVFGGSPSRTPTYPAELYLDFNGPVQVFFDTLAAAKISF